MKKDEVEYFGYKVEIDQYCDYSERSPGAYGDWEERWSNSMDRVCVKEDKYPNITSTLDIPKGSNALVVWAEWSHGDSFGRADNGAAEPFGIFVDYAAAEAFANWLNALRDNDKDKSFVAPDGQVFNKPYIPWFGYFESLGDVRIDTVTVF
jgi:hypothetical protein